MGTAQLTVTPEQLKSEADKVTSTTPSYCNAYKKLYAAADSLRGNGWWRGEANDSFQTQIQTFRTSFVALEELLMRDFQFVLQDAFSRYSNTEQNLVSAARTLPTSSLG
jgi:WXG100 family type VII secretion target